ncbi:unnamed protein product [Closterium sp. NIES-54]
MYAVVDSSASDSVYSRVFSLGASVDPVPVASVGTCLGTSPGAAQEDALLSFTLDSGKSPFFFRNHTSLTLLPALVSVALADPTSGPVTARYTTTLPCPAVPSGFLTGFHVPLFSKNLVGVRPLVGSHVGVWFEPSGDSATCIDERQQRQQQQQHQLLPLTPVTAPRHVPTSHQVPASHLVAVSGQVPASGPVAASCSCRSLAHPTVLWHHRLGHPSLPHLCSMSSQRLVLSLLQVLPSLPPSPAPPCAPCVKGWLCATPHSSSLRPATEPFETLHLDVWGPASCPGPERESFFLVVVDDYSRYTTVFPLVKKSEVTSMLIRWLLPTADTRGRRVSCLHSDRGDEFRSGILAGFCREQGIRQSWTLPESPQQNGVAERRIGLVMEVARTSMTHARAPHFLWPYAAWYAAHQLNLWPRVSRPEVSPTSLWTGSLGVVVFSCLGLLGACLPVPPPPLFLTHTLPLAPPVQPPPPGPAPSGVSHTLPPPPPSPSIAPQVPSPSPQSSSLPTADPAGAGVCERTLEVLALGVLALELRVYLYRVLVLGPSSADPSLFVRHGSTPFFVLVYVEDLVFATADRVALADAKSKLQKRHMCTDLGELRHYLGMQVTRDRAARTITLSQSHMVLQVLQRFGLQHSTLQRTPLAVDHKLTGPFPNEPFEPCGPYAELVGCIMYLMTCTRTDLAFPLSILAHFVVPGRHHPVHWTAAVRVAKYLATTSGVGLVLGGRQSVVLTGHFDSSYAADVETHRSTQGYCFSMGYGAVLWRSTRSSSVSTSTAEAEIYARAMAAQELRWLTFLLADLGERPSSASTLFTYNKAMILLYREPRLESRVKHINVIRLLMPFLFSDLLPFSTTADLVTHLRSLDASYRVACTATQLESYPPPIFLTLYFIVTRLPDRLSSPHDALLARHPIELTIDLIETSLNKIETRTRSIAYATGAIVPHLFEGCALPQLPTFTTSVAAGESSATKDTAAAAGSGGLRHGKGGTKGGKGSGGGGGGGISPIPPDRALSGVSHTTPLPSVASPVSSSSPLSSSQSPQQPLVQPQQVTVDTGGAGSGGVDYGVADAGGAGSRGAHTGGADSGGAHTGGAGSEGAAFEGADVGGSDPMGLQRSMRLQLLQQQQQQPQQ